jgi:hypothetical protein
MNAFRIAFSPSIPLKTREKSAFLSETLGYNRASFSFFVSSPFGGVA